jgi:hypothetical protein
MLWRLNDLEIAEFVKALMDGIFFMEKITTIKVISRTSLLYLVILLLL